MHFQSFRGWWSTWGFISNRESLIWSAFPTIKVNFISKHVRFKNIIKNLLRYNSSFFGCNKCETFESIQITLESIQNLISQLSGGVIIPNSFWISNFPCFCTFFPFLTFSLFIVELLVFHFNGIKVCDQKVLICQIPNWNTNKNEHFLRYVLVK